MKLHSPSSERNLLQAFRELRAALRRRPDSEHGQVLVRFCMCLLAGSLLIVGYGSTPTLQEQPNILLLLWSGMLMAAIQLGLILRSPGVSHARRISGLVYDYGAITLAMHVAPQSTSFLYVILMWVTVGNGLRYGNRYLVAGVLLATISFGMNIASTGYWRSLFPLSYVLLTGLVLIPCYACGLLLGTHRQFRQMEIAVRERTKAIASVGHEFRTALNTIALQAELLGSDILDEDSRKSSTLSISAAAQTMLGISRSVMGLLEAESRSIKITPNRFNLQLMINGIESVTKPLAHAKGLALTFIQSERSHGNWIADESHLRQIMINLISNAIKYTDQGAVQVDVDISVVNSESMLQVEVSDTGPGLPEDVKASLFRPFIRGLVHAKGNIEGTGLGLHISHQVISAMRGSIDVASREGEGTKFMITVPVARAVNALDQVQPSSPDATHDVVSERTRRHRALVQPLNIMVVDDTESTRFVLRTILTKCGHEVVTFDSPDKALDAIASNTAVIDLALVDYQMPEMDGFEFARHVNVMLAGTGRQLPMCLITAGIEEDTIHTKDMRFFRAVIPKPMTLDKLLKVLEDHFTDGMRTVVQFAPRVMDQKK